MIDLNRKIDIWKNKLLDLSKRNPLLNYKDNKRSSLRIKQPNLITLWNAIVLEEKELQFQYFDDSYNEETELASLEASAEEMNFSNSADEPSYIVTNQPLREQQKILRNIRNKARTILQEQGVNVLSLTFGFLKWSENENSKQEFTSPLVLVPITIHWDSINSPFKLKSSGDDIVVNPTLIYKLENDFGIKFPEFDEEEDITQYLDKIIKEITTYSGWSIEKEIGLGLFSFLKINMYKDLDLNQNKIKDHPVVRALCGDVNSVSQKNIQDINNYDYNHDGNSVPSEIFQVVDADSSQQDAILYAKRGVSFVLQGPPGTGKSQTITNIIAELLAEGKKILFVSEKIAALEVVFNRLDNVGLSEFCLDLHSHKASKKEVLEQLNVALLLSQKNTKLKEEAFQKLESLKSHRDELNAYSDAIHENISPFNKSIYEVNGKLANLQNYDEIVFNIDNIDKISPQGLAKYTYLLTNFSDKIGEMTGDYKNNPWYSASMSHVSHDLRHNINAKVPKLITQSLYFSELFDNIHEKLSLNFTPNYSNLKSTIDILKSASMSPIIPLIWLTEIDIESLYNEVSATSEMMDELNDILKNYNTTIGQIEILGLIDICDLKSVQSLTDVKNSLNYFEHIIHANSCYSKWSSLSNMSAVEKLFFEALNQSKQHNKLVEEVTAEYNSDILNIDYKNILMRFKLEYTSFFKFLKKQYKLDKRVVQVHMKDFSKKIDDNVIINTLSKLNEIHRIRQWFDENNSTLNEFFPNCTQGINTDFSLIKTSIELFSLLNSAMDTLVSTEKLFTKIDDNGKLYLHHYEFLYEGIATNWSEIRSRLEWTSEFSNVVKEQPLSKQFIKYICTDKSKIDECTYFHSILSEKFSEFSENYKWFSDLFDEEGTNTLSQLTLSQLADRCKRCVNEQSLLEEWIDFRVIREKCIESGLGEYLDKIQQQNINKSDIVPIFEKRFYRLWLDTMLPKFPTVLRKIEFEKN